MPVRPHVVTTTVRVEALSLRRVLTVVRRFVWTEFEPKPAIRVPFPIDNACPYRNDRHRRCPLGYIHVLGSSVRIPLAVAPGAIKLFSIAGYERISSLVIPRPRVIQPPLINNHLFRDRRRRRRLIN